MGKTTTGFNSYGVRLSDDTNQFVVNNGVVAQFNRRNGDGELLGLFKDDSTVGSIGTISGNPFFAKSKRTIFYHSNWFTYPKSRSRFHYFNFLLPDNAFVILY